MKLYRYLERAKEQLQWFCLSLTFLTRCPIPIRGEVTPKALARCHRWFALSGALIGLGLALVYGLAVAVLPVPAAVLVTLVASLLLTGALHEDGLADCVDGLGGGRTLEERLAIMKDSRVGSYGVLALVVSVLGRLVFLSALGAVSVELVAVALMVVNATSRATAALLMGALPYLRREGPSRVRAMTGEQKTSDRFWLAGVTLLLTFLLAGPFKGAVLAMGALFIGVVLWYWFKSRLGGVTGDALGAAQQVSELGLYLLWVALV